MITAVITALRQLAERREGAIAIIFALCAIPAVIAAGMAIDVGRAYMVKIRLGTALDAAALAVGSETNQTQTQLTTALQNYFTANYPVDGAWHQRHGHAGAGECRPDRLHGNLSGASHRADDLHAASRGQQH